MTDPTEVWVTGFGLASAVGHDPIRIRQALADFNPTRAGVDERRFAPYVVHPLAPFPVEEVIPQRSDRRAMGPTMQSGTFAAGRALARAGLLGHPEWLGETDVLTACHCNDRDEEADELALSEVTRSDTPGPTLNRILRDNLRPSLFLAQLPNILAGNISIVLGVTGTSQTLLGEEAAGANAIEVAYERLRARQSDVVLVGGAFTGDNQVGVLRLAAGGVLHTGPYADVWSRGGMDPGAGAAFLVLERAEHARARGAPPVARLSFVSHARGDRRPGSAAAAAARQWRRAAPLLGGGAVDVLSSASGIPAITAEEARFWQALQREGAARSVTGLGSALGSLMEAAAPMNLAVGLCFLEQRLAPPALSDHEVERAGDRRGPIERLLCNVWGSFGSELMALLEVVDA